LEIVCNASSSETGTFRIIQSEGRSSLEIKLSNESEDTSVDIWLNSDKTQELINRLTAALPILKQMEIENLLGMKVDASKYTEI